MLRPIALCVALLGSSMQCAWADINGFPATAATLGLKHGDVISMKCHASAPAVWLDGQVPNGNVLANKDPSVSGARWQVEVIGTNGVLKLKNLGSAPPRGRQFRYLSTNKVRNAPGVGSPFLVESNSQAESAWQFHQADIYANGKRTYGIAIRSVTKPLEWLRCRPGLSEVDFGYALGTFDDRLLWHIIKSTK